MLFSSFLSAQLATDASLFFEGGDAHEKATLFDFNGDGLEDIVVSGVKGLAIYQALDFPLGEFKRTQKIYDPVDVVPDDQGLPINHAFPVATVDLDGDDDLDLLTVRKIGGENAIVWYENDFPGGQFEAAQVLQILNGPVLDVHFEDVSGNLLPDLLLLYEADQPLYLYPISIDMGVPIVDLVQEIDANLGGNDRIFSGDLDGDDLVDIVCSSSNNNTISWAKNNGDNSFLSLEILADDATTVKDLAIADMDNDGDLDMVALLFDLDQTVWYKRNNQGVYYGNRKLIGNTPKPLEVHLEDLNNDGYLDGVVSGYNFNELGGFTHFINEGSGEFVDPVYSPVSGLINPDGSFLYARAIHDVDADGDLDILAFNDKADALAWALNQDSGAPNFALSSVCVDVFQTHFQYVDVADIDGDGRWDFAATSFWVPNNTDAWGQLVLATQTYGPGLFKIHAVYGEISIVNPNSNHHNKARLEDFDGDGDLDLVAGVCDDLLFSEYDQSTQSFGPLTYQLRRDRGLTFGDFDFDGLTDICVSDRVTHTLKFLKATASPLAFDEFFMVNTNKVNELHAGNIDGDDDWDILMQAGPNTDTDLFFVRNDDGFGTSWTSFDDDFNTNDMPFVELLDMDADGDLDIVGYKKYANNPNQLIFIENTDQAFSAEQILHVQPNSNALDLTWANLHQMDFDNDGDQDLIADTYTDRIACLVNDNDGSGIDEIADVFDGINHRFLGAFDLDADTDQDVILGHQSQSRIYQLENISDNPPPPPTMVYDVSGKVFLDVDENGDYDLTDFPAPLRMARLLPDNIIAYSDANGDFSFAVSPGDYQIELVLPNDWAVTSPLPPVYNFSVDNTDVTDLDFGVYTETPTSFESAHFDLGTPKILCNQIGQSWLMIYNDGTAPISGTLTYSYHPLFDFYWSSTPPDVSDATSMSWDVDDLPPGAIFQVILNFNNPPEGNTGDYIFTAGHFQAVNDDGEIWFDEYLEEEGIVFCSEDPNDKLVAPIQDEIEHFILYEDTLNYTVRFQNTGNFPAEDVVIKDTLDPALDWLSLRPITASHDYEVDLDLNTGELTFSFLGIMLPDSVNNEPESHGFVHFEIQPRQDAPEYTIITNQAAIYFDQNAPIYTNSVFNTLVTELPFTGNCTFDPELLVDDPGTANGYCPESIIVLTSEEGDSYQWYFSEISSTLSGEIIEGATNQSFELTVDDWNAGYFYCMVTIDDCTDPTNLFELEIVDLPDVPLVIIDVVDNLCLGDTLLLGGSPLPMDAYRWKKDGVLIPGANEEFLGVWSEGLYTLEGAFNPCLDYWRETISAYTPDFHIAAVPIIQLDGDLLVTSPGIAFQWYFNGQPISGATSQQHIPIESGSYEVEVVDYLGCSAFSSALEVVLDGVDEKTFSGINWSPNPAKHVLTIRAESKPFTAVSVFGSGGVLLKYEAVPPRQLYELQVSDLRPGVYICVLEMLNGSKQYFRWVKY